jgi:hypothetical protein
MHGPKAQGSTELVRLPDSSLGSHESKALALKREPREIILANQWSPLTLGCLGQERKGGGSNPMFSVESEDSHGEKLVTSRVGRSDLECLAVCDQSAQRSGDVTWARSGWNMASRRDMLSGGRSKIEAEPYIVRSEGSGGHF